MYDHLPLVVLARLLVKQHGDGAVKHVQRIVQHQQADQSDDAGMWVSVANIVEALLATERAAEC